MVLQNSEKLNKELENLKTEQKSKHGGARKGAGRKPKLQYEVRELFYNAVDARWDTILAKLDKLIARGDYNALRWVLEQRIGKAPQSVDIITRDDRLTYPIDSGDIDIEALSQRMGRELKSLKL